MRPFKKRGEKAGRQGRRKKGGMKGRKGRKEGKKLGRQSAWPQHRSQMGSGGVGGSDAPRVTVVGSLGTAGRKSTERTGIAGARNWMHGKNGGLGLGGCV